MVNYKTIYQLIACCSLAIASIAVGNPASAETVSRPCPFSCRTIGRANDSACSDWRQGNQCFVRSEDGSTPRPDLASAGAETTRGLKICLRPNGNLTVRGRCKSGDTLVDEAFLPQLSDINLAGVPSGSTILGVIGATNQAPTSSAQFASTASLGAKISPALASESIIVASSIALTNGCGGSATGCLAAEEVLATPLCTGTALDPTAPAGLLCIYPTLVVNSSSILGTIIPGTTETAGVALNWSAPAVGTTSLQGVWAYTAP